SYRIVARREVSDPAWSPDGRWLLYRATGASVQGLWLVPPDGSRRRRLVSGEVQGFEWSPDGRSILFTDGKSLVVYDVAADARRVIASYPTAGIGDAHWSPDGRMIAFSRTADGDLLVYDLLTKAAQVIASYLPDEELLEYGVGLLNWSPDARHLAFTVVGFYWYAVHVLAVDARDE